MWVDHLEWKQQTFFKMIDSIYCVKFNVVRVLLSLETFDGQVSKLSNSFIYV